MIEEMSALLIGLVIFNLGLTYKNTRCIGRIEQRGKL